MSDDVTTIAQRNDTGQREKLLDIERGKGIGILLVVYGHLVMVGTLGEQAWYQNTKAGIYLFHMPFFMYLSGFVFFYTKAHLAMERSFASFVAKRFDRLLIPFFAIAIISVFGKELASSFLHVDDGVSGLWDGLSSIITNGPKNPSISIWYLLVLFVYSVITPILWRLTGGRLALILIIAAAMHFVPAFEDFYVGRILRFYVFFVGGMVVCRHSDVILAIYRRYLVAFLLLFIAFLYIGRELPYALLCCGLACLPVLHGFVRLPMFDKDKALAWLGQNSMVIYLLNTIFIGLAKGIYVKLLPYNGPWFAVMIAVLMFAGVVFPLLFKRFLLLVPFSGPVYKYVR